MQKILTFLCFLSTTLFAQAQTGLLSPKEFLPTNYGNEFTPHHLVDDYFEYVAENSLLVKYQKYGLTTEKRQLAVAIISSEKNIKNLEKIRHNNLKITGLESGKPNLQSAKAIIWVNFGVHGNEPSSTESALEVLYQLAHNPKDWLKDVVIILNPSANPDGSNRHVSWNRAVSHKIIMPNLDSREHHEPWPGGRGNHYYFDLNRDWAWATQQETRSLLDIYHSWMPHVFPDMHEQFQNSPFYFAPAARPFHKYISDFQTDFQYTIGEANAQIFDQNGWLYFSREIFDLFYPSYGDTYSIFNGAIGMTFEQAGNEFAGRGIIVNTKDTLFIQERINHLVAASLATIQTAATQRKALVNAFHQYFQTNQTGLIGDYEGFVIKEGNQPYHFYQLIELLDQHQIQYQTIDTVNQGQGYSYQLMKNSSFQYQQGDLIIPTKQPLGRLVNVLFEPEARLEDSMTYDGTAWALPYAFGLEAYAVSQKFPSLSAFAKKDLTGGIQGQGSYAWLAEWKGANSISFLSNLVQKGLNVRYARAPIYRQNKVFDRGTIIITRADNKLSINELEKNIQTISEVNKTPTYAVKSGFSKKGPDLGSHSIKLIKKPKIAVVFGDNISFYQYGEFWYYMENIVKYPFAALSNAQLKRGKIWDYNTLVLVSGNYSSLTKKNKNYIMSWVKKGGKLILVSTACRAFADIKELDLHEEFDAIDLDTPIPFSQKARHDISSSVPGGIIKIKLDKTHPLAFGYDDDYYSMKTSDLTFSLMPYGENVGKTLKNPETIGFFGHNFKSRLGDNMILGSQKLGAGQVIFFVDDPLFRGFWKNGELLFANALFFSE